MTYCMDVRVCENDFRTMSINFGFADFFSRTGTLTPVLTSLLRFGWLKKFSGINTILYNMSGVNQTRNTDPCRYTIRSSAHGAVLTMQWLEMMHVRWLDSKLQTRSCLINQHTVHPLQPMASKWIILIYNFVYCCAMTRIETIEQLVL